MTAPKRTKRAKPDPELVKLADSLLTNYKKPEDLIGGNGLLKHEAQRWSQPRKRAADKSSG